MVAAHMDEIGLMVTSVDEGGFLRITTIGGVDTRLLPGQQVLVLAEEVLPGIIGTKPPHLTPEAERAKPIKLEDMFVDAGLSHEQALRLAPPGTPVCFRSEPVTMLSDTVTSSRLDNRVSVAILAMVAEKLAGFRRQTDTMLVATVQEELGMAGSTVSAYSLAADLGLAVDVGFGDMPGIPERHTSKMGGGALLAIGPNIHPLVYRQLRETCQRHGVKHQTEVCPTMSGTDAMAMQISRSGMPTGVVSIPIRHMHSTVETVRWSDMVETARLLAHFIADLDDGFWEAIEHAFD